MIEIEKYSCARKNEANAREKYWRIRFNAGLNSRKCFQSVEEKNEYQIQYNLDNHDKRYQYRLDNHDKCIEYQRKYLLNNKNRFIKYLKST